MFATQKGHAFRPPAGRTGQAGVTSTVVIIIVIAVIFIASFGYLILNPKAMPKSPTPATTGNSQNQKLQTYSNSKYGFSVQYPPTMAVREFPDTGDGAGFRPANTPSDPTNEVITVSVSQKIGDAANGPLETYAQTAATQQIQNYEKLNSINPVITNSGVTGYKTTWLVMPLAMLGSTGSGTPKASEPITYFPLPSPHETYTVQVILNDPAYMADYDNMIKTYSE